MSYTLTLTTESYLLTGSGEGGVLIDADVVFHATGFPMIPARRVKGMLKESLEEVLEITGEGQTTIEATLTSFFGEPGKPTYEGKLLFHNLMLPDWQQISKELSDYKDFPGFQPDFIKGYFTAEIQQTAIGRENREGEIEGVAKKRSLRNYRVIKPGHSFEGLLEITSPLSDEEEKLLKRAIINLRYAGTRRNRGFGKVKCGLREASTNSLESQAILGIQAGRLSVTITTQSPVVLAEQIGDQNTVFTRKYVSGNQIRGLLANIFIRTKGLPPPNAHLDSDFFEVFLSGKVQFGNAIFKQAKPIPLHLHGYKLDQDKPIISVFAKSEGDNDITKSVNKLGGITGNTIYTYGFSPKTTFNFHNSRPNRAAGRSTESDYETGIFYYESINENQTFQGDIRGEASAVAKLTSVLSSQFRARMGRSRSAQYGSVLVSLAAANESNTPNTLPAGKYVMTLNSPLILLNENGYPSPTIESLKNTLNHVLGSSLEVKKAAIGISYIEQYNSVWQAKSDKVPAFKEGSSFLIHFSESTSAPTQLGEWVEQGFGRIAFDTYHSETKYELEKAPDSKEQGAQESQEREINFSNDTLNQIRNAFHVEEKQLKVKTKAIESAQKQFTGIKNHLIGRVEALFQRATSQEYVDDWVKALFRTNSSGKPAAEALLNAGILHEVPDKEFKETGVKVKFAETGLVNLSFDLTQIYWITFFQTLRKKNKSDGKR